MTDVIPFSVLEKLIEAGRSPDIAETLTHSFPTYSRDASGYLTRLRPAPWQSIARSWSQDDLLALIRALTVAEDSLGWLSGSVSPASVIG